MPKITIDDKGIVQELPLSPTSLTISHLSNQDNNIITVNSGGLIENKTIAQATRFEYWQHSGSYQTASGSVNFTTVEINGQSDFYNGGLSTWNTSSNVFQPEALNTIYTIRFTGQIEPSNNNPTFHLDFVLSGSDPGETITRHHQSVERNVPTNADHVHIQGVYVVFADEDLYVSGGQFKISSDGKELHLLSASVLIKEG